MDYKILKTEVAKSIVERRGEIVDLKQHTENLIMNILRDSKNVMVGIDSLDKFIDVLVEVADDYTNTGAFEMIDSFVLKQGIQLAIKSNKVKLNSWFNKARAKVLEFYENAEVK
jgi:hypothetical protein